MLNYAYRYFYLRPKYVIEHLSIFPTILGVLMRNYILPKLGLDKLIGSSGDKVDSTPSA
jgi:hypothetical protein